jgi:hypothetical protein
MGGVSTPVEQPTNFNNPIKAGNRTAVAVNNHIMRLIFAALFLCGMSGALFPRMFALMYK